MRRGFVLRLTALTAVAGVSGILVYRFVDSLIFGRISGAGVLLGLAALAVLVLAVSRLARAIDAES